MEFILSFKPMLAGLVLALCATAPVQAATFKITLDEAANGAGMDWTGIFTAPAEGGIVTSIAVLIDGILYDTVAFGGGWAATYDAVQNGLGGVAGFDTILTPDPINDTQQPALFFAVNAFMVPKAWLLGNCGRVGCFSRSAGTYAITSAVPVPASLPLLAAAIGFLGAVRRKTR